MSIYSWITLIASITLILVVFLFCRKFLAGKENGLIIFSIIAIGVLISAALYVFTSIQGTQILASDLLPIIFKQLMHFMRKTAYSTSSAVHNF